MDFEKLEVWKRSSRLSVNIYKAFANCGDYGFKDQITRSSLSIPSNIAEGMERGYEKEKSRFLWIAKGSCAELRTQLYIANEIGYLNSEVAKEWATETQSISRMLMGLINKLGVK